MADRVAHAPDVSISAADRRADCHTGGKQRRPIDPAEVIDRAEHRRLKHSKRQTFQLCAEVRARAAKRGTQLPRPCSPRLSFASVDFEGSRR
jgi:hypothetical protein